VKIAEEFDQRHGHRVRCELVATTDARQQVVVREAQKDPLAAIAGAFASAKRQLRRLSLRGPRLAIAATPQLQPSGA
jgi:ribosome-associated translation inhibitor RaiA